MRTVAELKPLSAFVYLLRNFKRTAPLVGVIMLAVMLVNGIIALVNSIPYSIRTTYGYLQEYLAVTPRGLSSETPHLVDIIKQGSPVPIERVVIVRGSGCVIQSIVGKWPFVVLGLTQDDASYYLKRQHVTKLTGRMFTPGAAEAVVSRNVATNLNLKIGSNLLSPDETDNYSPKPVKVVGIAESDRWFAMDPIEYQRENHFPPIDVALVFARNLRDQTRLDAWATKRLKGLRTQLFSYAELEKETHSMFKTLFTMLNIVIGLIVGVITLMVAMLINIYQSQRILEFGLLQALGYTKRQLVWRSIREVMSVVVIGYLFGLALGQVTLITVEHFLMAPKAFALNRFDPAALLYTVPVPIVICGAAALTVWNRFRTFDPVGVVERRLV